MPKKALFEKQGPKTYLPSTTLNMNKFFQLYNGSDRASSRVNKTFLAYIIYLQQIVFGIWQFYIKHIKLLLYVQKLYLGLSTCQRKLGTHSKNW